MYIYDERMTMTTDAVPTEQVGYPSAVTTMTFHLDLNMPKVVTPTEEGTYSPSFLLWSKTFLEEMVSEIDKPYEFKDLV